MNIKAYFDDQAEYWDNSYEYNTTARNAAALVSGAAHGAYILDVGCGTGGMFPALIDAGASEITGVDLSDRMLEVAAKKHGEDSRIFLTCCDIFDYNDQQFDAAILFDVYQYFPEPEMLIKKMCSLIRKKGRLTVSFSFGRDRLNSYSSLDPDGTSRQIGSVWDEARIWYPFVKVDILCDTPDLYIISGTVI